MGLWPDNWGVCTLPFNICFRAQSQNYWEYSSNIVMTSSDGWGRGNVQVRVLLLNCAKMDRVDLFWRVLHCFRMGRDIYRSIALSLLFCYTFCVQFLQSWIWPSVSLQTALSRRCWTSSRVAGVRRKCMSGNQPTTRRLFLLIFLLSCCILDVIYSFSYFLIRKLVTGTQFS